MKKLDITSELKIRTACHDSVLQFSQLNDQHILLLKRCNLTCDTVRSLIRSLQSSHCKLQELMLDVCISDITHTTSTSSKLKMKSLKSRTVCLEFTGHYCDISYWLSQISSYTQLTELILHLERQDSTSDDIILQENLLYHHMLPMKSLKIESVMNHTLYLPLLVPKFIELQQNNLCNLLLSICTLSSDVISSLIHSLQSSHCRLCKLKIDQCTISTPNETQQNTISTKTNTTLCCY